MSSSSFENVTHEMSLQNIYMYKEDLALNNLKWLICRKTQLNQTIYILYVLYICIKRI